MTTGILNSTRVYLLGPVEFAGHEAAGWRDSISEFIVNEFDANVYNPLPKPSWLKCIDTDPTIFAKILSDQDAGYIDRTRAAADLKIIRRYCLRMVGACDWVIAYIPRKFTVGSFEELTRVKDRGTPVLFVCPDGVSGWLYSMFYEAGFLPNTIVRVDSTIIRPPFTKSFEELKVLIKAINNGNVPTDPLSWIWAYLHETDADT